jgi:hypothetical protein
LPESMWGLIASVAGGAASSASASSSSTPDCAGNDLCGSTHHSSAESARLVLAALLQSDTC